MAEVIGVRFKRAGKIHYFDPVGNQFKIGDLVVADGGRGPEIGRVVMIPSQVIASDISEPLKPIIRPANVEDLKQTQANKEKETDALTKGRELLAHSRLPMKILSVDSSLESGRYTFYFTAEGRVDFRDLAKELSNVLKAKVDLRQVGPRDEAKLLGGYGHCGRPLCCANHLTEFTPVSIKMAKEQELSLNPAKISGLCGRLLCCLAYEIEQYRLMRAKLPKKGQRVNSPQGPAVVLWSNPLTETAIVELESKAVVEYPATQLTVLPAASEKKPSNSDSN